MIDPESGADKAVDVAWRDALHLQVRVKRSRPFAYVLPSSEMAAAQHLQRFGVAVLRVSEDVDVEVDRYRISSREEAKKEDVRRNDDDASPSVIRVATIAEPARVTLKAGDFYVPMEQPLANLVSAALEPETQSSFVSNRLLTLPAPGAIRRCRCIGCRCTHRSRPYPLIRNERSRLSESPRVTHS